MTDAFDSDDWKVSVGGYDLPWTSISMTLEQFHVPGVWAVTAPLEQVDIPKALADVAPEVTISYKGQDMFVGIMDDPEASADEDTPDGEIVFKGRDLAGKLQNFKITQSLPTNQKASEMVIGFLRKVGLTDVSGVTATTEQIGDFVKRNYARINKGLSAHDVIFDLAELSGFVFRVHGRKAYFGPQPKPTTTLQYQYQRDFNAYKWRKSHTNQDVTVRVLSWNPKTKKAVKYQTGSGSIVVTRFPAQGTTPLQAKALGEKVLADLEKGLILLDITGVPGSPVDDLPVLTDILYGFHISGIAKGIDTTGTPSIYYPTRIQHNITRDEHTMDISLYNTARSLA